MPSLHVGPLYFGCVSGVPKAGCFKQLRLLPALLQKLVGEFFVDFWDGNFVGNLAGILRDFSDPQCVKGKAQTFWGKFRSIFREKIRGSKRIFRANFVLQTCHPKTGCLQFLRGIALFCAVLRPFAFALFGAHLHLRSFARICVRPRLPRVC